MEKFIVKLVPGTVRLGRQAVVFLLQGSVYTYRHCDGFVFLQLIGMALQYALDHMELKNCGETGNLQPL